MSDTFYRPLTDEQQTVESGMVIASGEANFAALDALPGGQGPLPLSGINTINTSGVESGLLYAPPASASGLLTAINSVSGITDSALADDDLSFGGNYLAPDLGIFRPYVHYYPARVQNLGSLYGPAWITVPVTIDYSFLLQPYTAFDRYFSQSYGYDAVDASGDPIFDDEDSIPPGRFG